MGATGTPPPNPLRIDPSTGLPLLDPFQDYVHCPHCGEAEVEVWCYQEAATCHNCGRTFAHTRPPGCGTYPYCKRGEKPAGS
jgi:hypothetical protein